MEMTLYHGSQRIIEKPIWGAGNPRNDYGLGFYCTEDISLAKEWACTERNNGFANRYILDDEGLSILNLIANDYHILNWLAILLDNRTFALGGGIAVDARNYILSRYLPDYKDFDIIRGYRADDSYFSFAGAFLNNSISLEQLGRAMRLGKLGEQIVLKSHKAFERLEFRESIPADKNIYYPMKTARDYQARSSFAKEKRGNFEGVYIIDIIRNNWSNDDPRLR